MKVITIMADFGLGPYAWQNGVQNIACAVGGFKGSEFKVSAALEEEFAEWIDKFEGHFCSPGFDWFQLDRNPGFDWESFHRTGIELSRRLKAEIGDQARVVYRKPVEDPARSVLNYEGTEILPDGTLKQLTHLPRES